MAKSVMYQLALGVAMLHKQVACQWQAVVLAEAGLDSRVCPVCGDALDYEWFNGVVWACSCTQTANNHKDSRAAVIYQAAQVAKVDVTSRYQIVNLLEIRSGHELTEDGREGDLVAKFARTINGQNPTWQFETFISMLAKEAPPVPQDLWIWYPTWWPREALTAFDKQQEAKWAEELPMLAAEAKKLGIEEAADETAHISGRIYRLKTLITEKRTRHAKAEHERQQFVEAKTKAQQVLDRALKSAGYYHGRLNKAVLPSGTIVLSSQSSGDRSDPIRFVLAPTISLEQLQTVAKAFDNSEVIDNGQITLKTTNPGLWIGTGGVVVKTLGKAVGRPIRVEKAEPKPMRTAAVRVLQAESIWLLMQYNMGKISHTAPFDLSAQGKLRKFMIDGEEFKFTVNTGFGIKTEVLELAFPRDLKDEEWLTLYKGLSAHWADLAEALKLKLGK